MNETALPKGIIAICVTNNWLKIDCQAIEKSVVQPDNFDLFAALSFIIDSLIK